MIKYDNNTIYDWNFGDDNIIKVYRNNAICYYKVSGGSPTAQTPCYAVVDNISQYQDTEFEDVFNNADGKWYKRNNLNQYEEYGVYGSGRNITYYEGKLTIDEEVIPQPSRLPQGYTEVEYIERNASHNGYVGLGEYFQANTRIQIDFQMTQAKGNAIIGDYGSNDSDDWRVFLNYDSAVNNWLIYDFTNSRNYYNTGDWSKRFNIEIGNYYIKDLNTGNYLINETAKTVFSRPNQMYLFHIDGTQNTNNIDYGRIYSLKIWQNDVLVKEFVPCQRDSDDAVGLYDIVNNEFHNASGGTMVASSAVTPPSTKATCEFIYSGNSWVNVGEVSGSTATLPNVPFVLNYNAKNYDATTHSIPMTSGQLNDTDAIAENNPTSIVDHSADGYITISDSSFRIRKENQDISLFNRSSNSNSSDMTIVCKAKTTNGENIITNRAANYNWMYRLKGNGYLTLHGLGETDSLAWNTSNADIMSVRTYYDNDTKVKYDNWTQNTSSTPMSFTYGSTNVDSSAAGALFVGYGWNDNSEQWSGDFYWVYMAQANLTDAQIGDVIDYNEGGGSPIYPMYYDVMQDPPDNVTFSSMTEAESYECPWWGMSADIDNTDYMFCETNEWLTKYVYQEVSGEYMCDGGNKYKKMQEYDRNVDGTTSATTNYVIGDLIESGSTDCGSRLPSGYTEVEYVENTSDAYINLGIDPYTTNGNSFTVQCTFSSYTQTNHAYLISCEYAGASPYYGFILRWNNGGLEFEGGSVGVDTTAQNIPNGDGTSAVTFHSDSTSTSNSNTPITLFCGWYNNSGWRNGKGRLYDLKMTLNNTVVRELVPCIRDNDNMVGLYDLANNVFYYPPTSSRLIAGPNVYPTPIDYTQEYLSLVAETNNVTFSYSTASSSNVIQYSTDSGTTWNNLTNGNSTTAINNGAKIMFKASGLAVDTERGIGKITPSASASVEGNIMSLAYGDNFSGQTEIPNDYQFRKLFSGVTTITTAENMALPATTIKKQCYSQMFQGCTNLVTAPSVIGSSAMTWNGDYCWSDMFNGCTSLTTAPQLPALNLGSQCYWYMFQGCTSLETAPELLATTVNTQSYNGMFSGCTSLNYIKVMASSGFSMGEWVSGVASNGTFIKNSSATFSSCGGDTYPCNWTVQNAS